MVPWPDPSEVLQAAFLCGLQGAGAAREPDSVKISRRFAHGGADEVGILALRFDGLAFGQAPFFQMPRQPIGNPQLSLNFQVQHSDFGKVLRWENDTTT